MLLVVLVVLCRREFRVSRERPGGFYFFRVAACGSINPLFNRPTIRTGHSMLPRGLPSAYASTTAAQQIRQLHVVSSLASIRTASAALIPTRWTAQMSTTGTTFRRRRIRRTARCSLLAAVLALSSSPTCDAFRCPSFCAFQGSDATNSGNFCGRGRCTPTMANENDLMMLAAPGPLLPSSLRRRSSIILMANEQKGSVDVDDVSSDSSNSSKKGWFGLGGGSRKDDTKDDALRGKQGGGGGNINKPSPLKRGFFRRGDKDEDGDVATASNSNTKRRRESKNKTSGGGKDTRDEDPSESSGGFLRWIVRSRGSSDDDDEDFKAKDKPDNKKNKKKKRKQKQKERSSNIDSTKYINIRKESASWLTECPQ